MMRRYPFFLTALLLILFVCGIGYLFALRQASGDSYAPYSSLRSDPLGTMALYEALQKMPGITVDRDYSQTKMPEGRNTTYLHLGGPARSRAYLDPDILKQLEQFAADGGRLVIAIRSDTVSKSQPGISTNKSSFQPDKDKKDKKKKRKAQTTLQGTAQRQDKWNFDFAHLPLEVDEDEELLPAMAVRVGNADLPEEVDWHSTAILTNLAPGWKPIYLRNGQPVVAEYRFGSGSVVLATDSFFLSNEGLSGEPDPRLLLWTIGDSSRVFFDEAHLGTTVSPGVSTLIRKYRLTWFMVGLTLFAGLYIWKNAVRLPGPDAPPTAADRIEGKSASAGFINLLRRNLRPAEVPRVCLDEWKRALSQSHRGREKAAEAEHIFFQETGGEASARDPVGLYNQIKAVIKPARKS